MFQTGLGLVGELVCLFVELGNASSHRFRNCPLPRSAPASGPVLRCELARSCGVPPIAGFVVPTHDLDFLNFSKTPPGVQGARRAPDPRLMGRCVMGTFGSLRLMIRRNMMRGLKQTQPSIRTTQDSRVGFGRLRDATYKVCASEAGRS